jgi:biopolymer transport protein ExbB
LSLRWFAALGLVALLGRFSAGQAPMSPNFTADATGAANIPHPVAAAPSNVAPSATAPAAASPAGASPAALAPSPAVPGANPAASPSTNMPANSKSMLQVFRDGGPLMYPIVGCSFLLVVFFFERFISLRKGRVIPRPFSRKFIEQLQDGLLDRESALDLCEENPSPVSDVFAAAIKRWGRPAVEVEQAILDTGERVTNDLRRNIRLFNAISTVSPLLGLLGTVFGMISCFQNISSADAMGRPEMLAGGIGEALLTTAGGLAVAIPALVAYWFFVSRVDSLIVEIDGLGQRVVEVIAAEAKLDAARLRAARRERRSTAADSAASAGESGKRPSDKNADRGSEKNGDKSGEKAGEKGSERSGEKSGDKGGERSRDRAA